MLISLVDRKTFIATNAFKRRS